MGDWYLTRTTRTVDDLSNDVKRKIIVMYPFCGRAVGVKDLRSWMNFFAKLQYLDLEVFWFQDTCLIVLLVLDILEKYPCFPSNKKTKATDEQLSKFVTETQLPTIDVIGLRITKQRIENQPEGYVQLIAHYVMSISRVMAITRDETPENVYLSRVVEVARNAVFQNSRVPQRLQLIEDHEDVMNFVKEHGRIIELYRIALKIDQKNERKQSNDVQHHT